MASNNTLNIKINAETAKATQEINRLNKEVKNLGRLNAKTVSGTKAVTKSLDQTSRSFASLTKHISQLAIIYGAFSGLQTTVRTFADFEESMSRLGVISGATSTELAKMQDVAEDLGSTTVFTASQVAEGMNAMAMAGVSASESMSAIGATLSLASIGQISVADSSLIATRAMNGFNLEADEVGRIADVMAKAVTTSATTVSELGDAYRKVGSVSEQFGNSIEETTAVLGVFADAGRVGAEAGTQLKIAMLRLSANVEVKKYLQELSDATGGLSTNMYDATGKVKPFIEQVEVLKIATAGLSEEARNTHLARIVGSEAIASFSVAINNLDEMKLKVIELENSFGFAGKTAKELMNNLKGDFAEFNSALEGVIIDLGKGLSPVLRELLDEATAFLQALDKDEIEAFGEGIGELAIVLGDMVNGLITVVGAVSDFSKSIKDVTGISGSAQIELLALGFAMSKLLKPLKAVQSAFVGMSVAGVAVAGMAGKGVLHLTGLARVVNVVKVAFAGLITLLKTNFLGLAITGAITAYLIYSKWADANEKLEESLVKIGITASKNTGFIDTTAEALENLSITALGTFNSALQTQISDTEKEMKLLEQTITDTKDKFGDNKDEIIKLKIVLNQHRLDLHKLKLKEEELIDLVAKKISLRRKEGESLTDFAKRIEEVDKATTKLIETNKKLIESMQKTSDKRQKTADETLGKLYDKEASLVQKLIDLDQKLSDAREDSARDRLADLEDLDAKIADSRTAGLNDYQKYLDAQKRKTEVYAKALQALLEGDPESLKRYMNEYTRLIGVGGAEAIKVSKEVQVWDEKARKYKTETKEIEMASTKQVGDTYRQDANNTRVLIKGFHDLTLAEKEAVWQLIKE